MLGCLRNPDRVGTTVSSVRQVRLDERRDGYSAARTCRSCRMSPTAPTFTATPRHRWPRSATATACPPWLRPTYTPIDDADDEFRSAYENLGTELERTCRTAVLEPGELLLVDNDVVVHGRVPFTPRYDGSDRWLKRVNVRLPQRRRPAAEAAENGYGQHTVTPFRPVRPPPGPLPRLGTEHSDQ